MNSFSIKGFVRNGRVEVDRPIDLPNGTPVVVTTDMSAADDDGSMSPEEIARVLAAMQEVEPFMMTEQEQAESDAWLQKIKEYTIGKMNQEDAISWTES